MKKKIYKKGKLWIPLFCVIVVIGLASGIALCCRSMSMKSKGEEIFNDVQSALSDYPQLPESYTYTEFYYCDGSTEYLFLKNGSNLITGVRTAENTTYYMEQKSWRIGENGNPEPIEYAEDPVQQIARTVTSGLLEDEKLTYAWCKARGGELPLWVYPDETYIFCSRPDYTDCVEIMVFDEKSGYLRWDIARTAEDAVLYLYADDEELKLDETDELTVFTWGDVDKAIVDILRSRQEKE